MGRSKAPGPADAAKIMDWNRRQSDHPDLGGQLSFTLDQRRVRATIESGEVSEALGALEMLAVLHDHLHAGLLSLDNWNEKAAEATRAGMPHISIPVDECFLPIVDAYARYVESGPRMTLGATFIKGSTNQGVRAHTPGAIRTRRKDFKIALDVVLFCVDRGKRGKKTTLDKAFEHVAKQYGMEKRSVEKVYRAELPILRPFIERTDLPISFPD